MADDELEKLLADDGDDNTPAPAEPQKDDKKSDETEEQKKAQLDLEAKRKELEDLDKAKTEALAELSKIRKAKKLAKKNQDTPQPDEEEEAIPQINMQDPSAQAWDRHIRKTVEPMESESEKEKAEILDISLKKFLADKPALAKNSDKLKELMETYDSLAANKITGKNSEVVLNYLDKAYAAVEHEKLFQQIKSKRLTQVQEDIIFSDPAISSGAGSYSSNDDDNTQQAKITQEQRAILAKWGMTPQEWLKVNKEHGQK